ncbi:histone deacetylase HosB [Histoplasma capsulatum]|uniref:Histone deacetylase HosB n=1 Tax=Ajellomyces capsulatus TaxID=5037 RepID=A0A8A1M8L5_AJECA|nr:histone deacetylase HosB [Histoplasma capsulatum]
MDQSRREQPGSAGNFQGGRSNRAPDELTPTFNRLSLATGSVTSGPSSSPSPSSHQSPSRSLDTNHSHSRHDSPSRAFANHPSVPRRTPSSSSLRDERRVSPPSLQKRSSVSSLRSVQNYSGSGVAPPRPSLSRRASSNFLATTSPSMRPKSPAPEPAQPVVPTATAIAREHFEKELALHQSTDLQSKTLVLVQDACYGHRFSRPRTSKAGLEQIVERPERLLASILGVSTAYIRMGRRYGGGRFAPHPDLDVQSLPTPPFQIRKTTRTISLNSPAVTHVHGAKWMEELQIMCKAAESRLALNGKELVRPSSSGRESGAASTPKLHEGDLYLCRESLNAFEGALGGVCEAVDAVFGPTSITRAFVNIRPPGHHCSVDYPSGFCWLNNVHVGITHAAMSHGLTHAAIIDFDLHHGDGSQDIAWEQNRKASAASRNSPSHKKTAIGYFSLHDINSYPCEAGDVNKVRNASVCIDNAHGQSVWNIHLEPWKTSAGFWELYNTKYSILLEKARNFLRYHTQRLINSQNPSLPKAAIFISAGFDASEWEGVGMQRHKVNVPTDFYAKFTADIVQIAEDEALGVDGRVISVLEGGYSDRALISGVLSHLSGLADSQRTGFENGDNRLATEMISRLGLNDCPETVLEEDSTFDTEWWTLPMLETLELLANPPPPTPARKSREKGPPTYCSPTQASAAKIVLPSRDRRSISSQLSAGDSGYPRLPLPVVDWATAAYEMSKVLIPTNRQTVSLQHSELKGENTRTKRDRHSTSNVSELNAADDRKPMQLRERKPKPPSPEHLTTKQPSKASRRATIASVSDIPDASATEPPESCNQNPKPVDSHSSRRLSVASTVASTGGARSRGSVEETSPPSSNGSSARRIDSRRGTSNGKSGEPLTVKKLGGVRTSPRKPSAARQARPIGGGPIPPVRSSSINTDTSERDLTNLSAGMRTLNIKLKVPSPEEHAAREEERRKIATSRSASRKSQTSKASRSSSTTATGKVSNPDTALAQSPPPPPVAGTTLSTRFDPIKQEMAHLPHKNSDIEGIPIPDLSSFPHSANSYSEVVRGWPSDPTTKRTHIEPSKNPSPASKLELDVPPRSYAHISPPLSPLSLENSGTHPQITVKPPSAPLSYHIAAAAQPSNKQLPVFTSTSAIPFATPTASNAPSVLCEEERRE